MKKITLFLSFLITSPIWASGPASLTVSSGTFLAVDGFTNTNGNFRQTATIGDAVGQQTIKVDASSSAYINLQEVGGAAISASNPVPVQSTGTTAVSGTFWQTTQPVSGSVNATVVNIPTTTISGTVPVSGTFWQATQPVSGSVNSTVVNIPTTTVSGSVAVTGTFWQATQPISGTVSANATVVNIPTTTISGTVPVSGTFWQATQPVSGTVGVTGSSVTIYSPNNNTTPIPVTATLSSGAQSIVVNTSTQTVGYGTGLSSVPVNVLNTVNIAGSVTSTPGPIEVVSSSGGYINVGWQTSNGSVPVVLQGITTSAPLPVQSTGTTAVSGTFWQTTQPVSGTVGVTGSSVTIYSPNNNTTAIPVSGTFFQSIQPVSQSGNWNLGLTTVTFNGSGQPVTQSGSWTVASTQSGNWNVGLTTVSTSGQDFAVDVSSWNHSVVVTGGTAGSVGIGGLAASGGSVVGNPLNTGHLAATSLPAAVSNAQMVSSMSDKFGRTVAILDCPRDLIGQSTITLNSSTAETLFISTGAANVYDDLVSVIAINTSATATRLDFRSNGVGGTIAFALYVPAGDTRGLTTSHIWPQSASATEWSVQSSASVSDVRVYATYCQDK